MTTADSVPAHLQPDGPFADLLPKSPVTPTLVAEFRAAAERSERLLSESHIAAIDQWLASQPDERPETKKARVAELKSYLGQVAASTILAGSERGVERLAKAAFVMGAWIDDPRETEWRLLRYPAQAAASVSEAPASLLSDITRQLGPVSANAFDKKRSAIERMPDLPLTRHQPTGLPLLEPKWDAEENARRLGLTAWLLGRQTSESSLPWDVPSTPYADATATSAPDGPGFVDALNRYLRYGSRSDATQAATDAESQPGALAWVRWAASYWHAERWVAEFPALVDADSSEFSDEPDAGLVAVARGGVPQLTWSLL